MHEDGRVDAHDILVEKRHSFPPVAFDVVFQFYAVLVVIVDGSEAVVDFAGLKHKPILFGVGYNFLKHIFLLCHCCMFDLIVYG